MSGDKETEVKNEPWKPVRGNWLDLIKNAQGAYDATSKDPFGGDYYAGPSDAYRADLGAGRDYFRSVLSGDFLSPDSNPFLKGAIDASINPVQQRLTEGVLPQLEDSAISGGAYGGARQGIEQNKAVDDFSKAALDTTSRISYGNYATERGYQARAPGDLFALGQVEQSWDQGNLADQYQKWVAQQEAPWAGLDKMLAMLSGTSGFGTTTTTQKSNPIAEILQGLSGAAGIAGSIFGTGGLASLLPSIFGGGAIPMGQGGIGSA